MTVIQCVGVEAEMTRLCGMAMMVTGDDGKGPSEKEERSGREDTTEKRDRESSS